MRTRWAGVVLVAIAAVGIVAYKEQWGRRLRPAVPQSIQSALSSTPERKPQIILVADLREADEPGDNCAEIIHLVRGAGKRGAKVQELKPDSDSALLKQYHVLTNPTVLILDRDGKVVSRYEGESGSTVMEIRNRLASLSEAQR